MLNFVPMDLLAEILRAIKIDSAIFLNGEFSEPWCIATPQTSALAPLLVRGAAHVIIYHLLVEGRAVFEVEDERIEMSPGDLVTLPHGDRHMLGSGHRVTPMDAGSALPGVLGRGLELLTFGGGGQNARFICGYLACDPQLSQAFLAGLPPCIRVNLRDDAAGQWLERSLRFSVTQAASGDAATSAILAKLSEAFLAETLRRYQQSLPPSQLGWIAGARNPEVGKALMLMHHQHRFPWTISDLAHEVGVSRSVLSERFQHFLGVSPIAYLTRWRLQLAARALRSTSQPIVQLASDIGYDSEASFNRAFKREYGMPPARYRRGHRSA